MIKISTRAIKALASITDITGTIERGVKNAAYEIGRETEKESKRLIQSGTRSGRIYKIRGATHQASAPGESPAEFSGELSKSIKYNVKGTDEIKLTATTPYAAKLELGPKDEPEKARPYLSRAFENRTQQNLRTLEYHVVKAISKRL